LDEKSDRYLLLDKNPVAAQQESYNYSFLEERFLKILALWTPEEKKKLHKALKLYGTRFPHAIAKYVGTKNAVQVSQYLFHATALAQGMLLLLFHLMVVGLRISLSLLSPSPPGVGTPKASERDFGR